jgi:hypothetical protein
MCARTDLAASDCAAGAAVLASPIGVFVIGSRFYDDVG